jgi:adenosylcobinamide-GDP ribazoletransferase
MAGLEFLGKIVADIRTAVSFCLILPVASVAPANDGELARASWALPIAGLVVGLAGAIVYAIARAMSLPPDPAAALALAATLLITGALHEDGLADTVDGFGGGKNRDQKLEIMRDSRIGTYGTCALILSMIARWSALATIAESVAVTMALLAAHAAGRATLPVFMWLIPPARSDGLSAGAGRPPSHSALLAAALGFLCIAFGLGFAKAVIGLCVLSLISVLWAWLATRQVGGQTGDILGALEQSSEIAVLLMATALI